MEQLELIGDVVLPNGYTGERRVARIHARGEAIIFKIMVLNIHPDEDRSQASWKTMLGVVIFKIGDICNIPGEKQATGKIASFSKNGVFVKKSDGTGKVYNYTTFCGHNI